MLRTKASIEKWAKEIVRCEKVLNDSKSTQLEKRQCEWKIEAIMDLYSSDIEATLILISQVENFIL